MTAQDYLDCELKPGACIIEVDDGPEQTDGGILYADRYRPMPGWGYVRKLHPTCQGEGVEVGDAVIFKRWAGKHFETDDRRILVLCDFVKHVECVIEGRTCPQAMQ